MDRISRRIFLKSAGIIGASLVIAPKWLVAETIHYHPKRQIIYVDSFIGNDLYSGASWSRAVKTFTEACKRVLPRGTIYLCPDFQETMKELPRIGTFREPITIIGAEGDK